MVSCPCLDTCGDFQLPITVGLQPFFPLPLTSFFKLQNFFFKRSLNSHVEAGWVKQVIALLQEWSPEAIPEGSL